jgi:Protein of unknown function (DUF664)
VYASAEVVGTERASGRVAVRDAENGLGVVAFVVEDQQIGLGTAKAVASEELVLSQLVILDCCLRDMVGLLTGEHLALASVSPSNLSLLGIVRHMADMERTWFRIRFRGEPLPRLYDHEDAAFEYADPGRAEADFAAFTEECDLARKAVARASLEGGFTGGRGRTLSLRWVYTHMIEEYARNNGHAALLRQRIDGATGS